MSWAVASLTYISRALRLPMLVIRTRDDCTSMSERGTPEAHSVPRLQAVILIAYMIACDQNSKMKNKLFPNCWYDHCHSSLVARTF